MSPAVNNLFPEAFLAAVGGLSLVLADARHGVRAGAHLSRAAAGSSTEFRDHQPYSPGDDLRRVDWNVYGRTRHLVLRRFERPTAVPVHVMVDGSPSMSLGTPGRYPTAARLAVAIAAASLAGGDPVGLSISGRPVGPPAAGRPALARLLEALAASRPPARVGPAAAVRAALAAAGRRPAGVLVVISDLFEPAGVDALLDALRAAPGRLVLLRVTHPTDADPPWAGPVALADCEADADVLHVDAGDPGVRDRYRSAYGAYFAAVDGFAAARGAVSATIDAAADTLPQLAPLFPGGVMAL
jgi:uncharacterized protein (DUF58 family)